MSLQQNIKETKRLAADEVSRAVNHTWTTTYEGNTIRLHNELMQETLYVNDIIVAQKVRTSLWSHIWPKSYLKAQFTGIDGRLHTIHVSIGGIVAMHIKMAVDGTTIFNEKMKIAIEPWSNKEAILPYIEAQLAQGHVTEALPDDRFVTAEGEQPMPPGLADQVFVHDVPEQAVKKLIQKLKRQLETPSPKHRRAYYEAAQPYRLIDYLDTFIFAMQQEQFSQEALMKEAQWLYEHAAHREVAKLGIALFGFCDASIMKERLQKIAQHEEFTGVVLFALQQSRQLQNTFVFTLCQQLPSWGKVAAIDFLDADSEAIRTWLLTQAIHSTVLPEYIAMYCVEKGKLDIVLHEKTITAAQYEGAASLIRVLLESHLEDRLDVYEFTGQMMQRFAYHSKAHAVTPTHFYTLALIARYMEKEDVQWDELYRVSWQPFQRHMTTEAIAEIAEQPQWKQHAIEAVESDAQQDEEALAILYYYGENVNNRLLQKLAVDKERYVYYEMIVASQEQQAIAAAASIASQLPFATMSDDAEMSVHMLLEALAQAEGVGGELITACLQSDDPSLVYNALHLLSQWSTAYKSPFQTSIAHVEQTSKDKEIRKLAKALLQ